MCPVTPGIPAARPATRRVGPRGGWPCQARCARGSTLGETDEGDPGDRPPRDDGVDTPSGAGPAASVPMADVDGRHGAGVASAAGAHVPDRLGESSRLASASSGSGEPWPCSLHRIATEARRLHDQKLTEAIDSERSLSIASVSFWSCSRRASVAMRCRLHGHRSPEPVSLRQPRQRPSRSGTCAASSRRHTPGMSAMTSAIGTLAAGPAPDGVSTPSSRGGRSPGSTSSVSPRRPPRAPCLARPPPTPSNPTSRGPGRRIPGVTGHTLTDCRTTAYRLPNNRLPTPEQRGLPARRSPRARSTTTTKSVYSSGGGACPSRCVSRPRSSTRLIFPRDRLGQLRELRRRNPSRMRVPMPARPAR